MKNVVSFLFCAIMLIACTHQDEISSFENDSLHTKTQQLYKEYRCNTQKNIANTLMALNDSKSRGNLLLESSGSILVDYLASLSVENLDSLYNLYCSSTDKLIYENFSDSIIDLLVDNSSMQDVQDLLNFSTLYIEAGGHIFNMLSSAIQEVSPLIRQCMISCAASIDEFIEEPSKSRAANSYCLHMLSLQMAESFAMNGIAEVAVGMIGVPGVDVATSLILAGYDLYSSIDMAHKYHRCCAGHVS